MTKIQTRANPPAVVRASAPPAPSPPSAGSRSAARRSRFAGSGQRELGLRALAVGGALLAWVCVSLSGIASSDTLPSPWDLVREAINLQRNGFAGASLLEHVLASATRAAIGLGAAVAIGLPLGLLMGYYRVLNSLIAPLLSFVRPVPAIAFVPLVVFYFGIGEFAKIFVIFLTTLVYFVLTVSGAVAGVSESLIRIGHALGLRSWKLFWHIIFPASMPGILTGLRIATAVSWTLVVAAELIAADKGLGFLIITAATFGQITYVYVGIVLIGVIGFFLETIVALVDRRLLHWVGR